MPSNVTHAVKPDFCLPAKNIPEKLVSLARRGTVIKIPHISNKEKRTLAKTSIFENDPTGYTCPECGGVVAEIKSGKIIQFRCHVGHKFSLADFTEAHADALERALWIALRKLNEHRDIQERLAKTDSGIPSLRKRHQENAEAAKHDIGLLHEILGRL